MSEAVWQQCILSVGDFLKQRKNVPNFVLKVRGQAFYYQQNRMKPKLTYNRFQRVVSVYYSFSFWKRHVRAVSPGNRPNIQYILNT